MRSLFISMMALLMACAPKTAPQAAADATPVTLAMSHVEMDSGRVVQVPERMADHLTRALTKNGYQSTLLAVEDYPSELKARTKAPHRALFLAKARGSNTLFVLVEAKALFYSQLRGQNRWVVSVEATALSDHSIENAIVERFEVPVFLRYNHEREPEALATAGPTIAQRVSRMVQDARALAEGS